ncbi:MAG: polymerase [Spirochaetaceae bacterium]|jgi:hypothetical protein|nr:polymerase [Spirochaetaceae bacterium]
MKPRYCLVPVLALALTNAAAQGALVNGALEWERMELSATVTLDLAGAGIRLPAGRARAEALLEDEYPALIQPFVLAIQVDSDSTLGDLIDRGEISLHTGDSFAANAHRIPPSLSPDLSTIFARYTVSLRDISRQLIRHTRPREVQSPLVPLPTDSYTGIIIIADETLRVHGRSSSASMVPCIFPKIWDSEMTLVYERNMVDPNFDRRQNRNSPDFGQTPAPRSSAGARAADYAGESMVRYTSRDRIMGRDPSGIDRDLASLVGENPLRIIARGVFGEVPTDPIIDKDDALLILSSEANRRLLREGRVVLVLAKEELKKILP